jgi:hypothetical protein
MNVFEKWEKEMAEWHLEGGFQKAPEKPEGYDLWKQEEDALIKNANQIPCKGGNLIIDNWVNTLK